MLKIVPNPSVLDALIKAFPHPIGSAERQYKKYINKLSELFELSQLRGRNNFAVLFDAYDIPLKELHEYGGTIKKNRIHKWLNDNGLSLITNLRPDASNLTGLIALLKVTDLATVVDTHSLRYIKSLDFTERQHYLDNPNIDDKIASSQALSLLNANTLANRIFYDESPIDISSLKKYLHQLIDSKVLLNPLRSNYRFSIAMRILRMAQLNDGILFQLKSPSMFGRNYYKGLSIQTLPKDLRGPVLGSSWEYDAKSCATSWKMKYAYDCYQSLNTLTPFEHVFVASIDFLTDKAGFFDDVINATFDSNNLWSYEKKKLKIKEAFQALSFGAKLDDCEWIDAYGQLQQGVLMSIFDTAQERHRFQNFVLVEKMNTEQKLIDDYLYKQFRDQTPLPSKLPFLRDRKGWSKSKILSFLYQHSETQIMNAVATMIEATGNKILARIHDAIIVRNRLSQSDLQKIQKQVRTDFDIEYFQLGEKQLA